VNQPILIQAAGSRIDVRIAMPLAESRPDTVEINVMGIGHVASLNIDVDNKHETFKNLADFFKQMLGVRVHLETVAENIRQVDNKENQVDRFVSDPVCTLVLISTMNLSLLCVGRLPDIR
jgi:hypothetical protein